MKRISYRQWKASAGLESKPAMPQNIKKYVLFIAGSLSLAVGVIGIFIPMLPTTPLLLIAAYCYLRSSERMYNWLIHHRFLGIYIYNYLKYKAVPRKTKIWAVVFIWITLTISMILIDNWYVRGMLLFVGACVSVHLYKLKTLD